MTFSLTSLNEQPFTVLNGFSKISDHELTDRDVIIRDGARKLYDWWSDYVTRHGKLPTRRAFDILSMLPHAADMFLAARTAEGNWTYQLQGEEFKRLFNGGFQNNVEINCSFTAFPHSVADYLNSVAAGRVCRRSHGTTTGSIKNRNTFESIDCPLIDSTGRVSHIIGIAELYRDRSASPPARPPI